MNKQFVVADAGYKLALKAEIIGDDLLISLVGGDTPHIGTVTTLSAHGKETVTRFPSHNGRFHKDDVLAEVILERIQKDFAGTVVITSGVHVNRISQAQIEAAFPMTQRLAVELAAWLKVHPNKLAKPVYYTNEEKPR